ncbi:rod shape-determining protein MreC [bacterium]|nr:rod shape-determining protein MreC [bacterium]
MQASVSDCAWAQRCFSGAFSFADRTLHGIWYFKDLQEENERLKTELISLQHENSQLKYLKQQNLSLKKLMKLTDERVKGKAIFASVAARDPHSWNDEFTLDKGWRDGVCKDMVAVVPEGLVGRVKYVGGCSCRIKNINSEGLEVPVVLASLSVHGIMENDGKGRSVVRYISYDTEVPEGETVFTSGLGEIYPGGFAVGRVSKSRAGSDAFFQDIYLDLSVDFSKVETVALVKKSDIIEIKPAAKLPSGGGRP